MKQLDDDCPDGCKCVPERMIEDEMNSLVFIAKVDCSNLGLTKLPVKLPENTQSLNISNNSELSTFSLRSVNYLYYLQGITSLTPLMANENYQNIKSLFADDNFIETIVELEGSKFLDNFTKLSLKNNKIKEIPLYILSKLLEKSISGKLVYLGGNRIHCECQTFKNQGVSKGSFDDEPFYLTEFIRRFGGLCKIVIRFYATTCKRGY